eukprot:UN32190
MGCTHSLVVDAKTNAVKAYTSKTFIPQAWDHKETDLKSNKETTTKINDNTTLTDWLKDAKDKPKFMFGGNAYKIINYDKENAEWFVGQCNEGVCFPAPKDGSKKNKQ